PYRCGTSTVVSISLTTMYPGHSSGLIPDTRLSNRFRRATLYWSESKMTGLRKTFFVAGAAAALAITAVIQTPFAQDNDPAKSLMGPRVAAGPATLAANKKADATMTVEPNSRPMTDADKKAAAAM